MKFPCKAIVASALLAGWSSVAVAQVCGTTPTALPCANAIQSDPNRYYQIDYSVPYECEVEVTTASAAWVNAGSKFNPTWSPFGPYSNSKYYPGNPGYQMTFQPAAEMGAYASDNAVTYYGRSVGSAKNSNGSTIPVVDDADTIVNLDKYMAWTIECDDTVYQPTAQKFDFTRTAAHEMGHWAGFNHNTDTRCATYKVGQYTAFQSLCAAEINAVNTLYGAR